MDSYQIRMLAESEYGYLADPDYWTVIVSSSSDNAIATSVFDGLREHITKHRLRVNVIKAGSSGLYDLEPIVLVQKPIHPTILYNNVTLYTAVQIIDDYLVSGNPRPDIAFCSLGDAKVERIPYAVDLPLFSLQNRIALRNCGQIDPENIGHYILQGHGYSGLVKCLQMSQTEVIEEVRRSGLRGRGGAGYPTADKWRACLDAIGSEKYVVCNAIDADPQALTARLLLESDPHSVLEGILIAAYAVGASRCFICVSDRSHVAIKRLDIALAQMRKYDLLGNRVLGMAFNVEIEVKAVAANFVVGEETALLSSLEGKQPMPYLRREYPAIKGFLGKPTLVNNVETFSNVSAIFREGSVQHSDINADSGKGTKVITLSGKTIHKYTIEIPLGTTLRSVVMEIGDGISNEKKIKAVQFGGPTGVYFDVDSWDTPIDYESFNEADTIIGSGTVEVFDCDSCAVDIARDATVYLRDESCGKCVFCREGSYQIAAILTDIIQHGGKLGDLDLLVELGEAMKTGSICDLGRTAAYPLLSSIRLFRDEYDFHVKEKRCPLDSGVRN